MIANLRYLDVAVVQEMWRRWKLPDLFNRLIPQKHEAIAPSAVIAALVAHRCTDPGSKLYAQRWFPRTALPELLHVPVEQFGNTRIHRVLDSLDRIDSALQADLADRYQRKEGVFATLFMDVTDAWFAGRGPEMAERNRTKEGLRNKHKVGIVLVCNEHGYPLRWQVVPGKRREPLCMQEMLSWIQDEAWLGDIPLVCDRAMGQAGSVAKLVESGVRFLTASCRPEISSYTDAIPYEAFLKLSPIGSEITRKGEMETAARLAEEVGLKKVDDLLYVHDLGVCERKLFFDRPKNEYSGATWDPDELEGGASFIALARIFQDRLNKKEFRNKSELAEKEGLTRARVTQVMNTIKIDRELQERILRGEFGYVSERLLRDCVKLDTEVAQRELLEEKDFQTIKDVVKLRPLYHHTDAKVRAHVTLCMLALLIERSIERRLKRSGMATTAAACFEELRECHLNQVESDLADEPTYAMTDPTQEQLAILRSLRMTSLIDPEEVAERLRPRRTG